MANESINCRRLERLIRYDASCVVREAHFTSPAACSFILSFSLDNRFSRRSFQLSKTTSARLLKLQPNQTSTVNEQPNAGQKPNKMAVGGCLSAVCRFISDFMRLILFFVSIVFMMLSVFLFAKSFQGKDTFDAIQVANANSCFLVILALATYLIALSVFGIHATFFRHGMMIEWVSTSPIDAG